MSTLDGTLPVRPFHPDRFFGTVQVDGQHPRVATLACHELDVVAISLVGYDTSVSAGRHTELCVKVSHFKEGYLR